MPHAQKRSVNLSLDAKLLERARRSGLNVSRMAEAALRRALAEESARLWRSEHAQAIEAYNQALDDHGTFASTLPGWWNRDGAV